MTAEPQMDPRLYAWLDQMPTEAPDRVIQAVLMAVEATPQQRRPLVHGPWRAPRMQRLSLIAVTAAVAVAAVGGALLLAGGRDGQPSPSIATQPSQPSQPSSSPAPTPSSPTQSPPVATPATSGADLPAELVGVWFGSHRDVPGIPAGIGTALSIGPTQVAFAIPNSQSRLIATTPFSLDEDGRLQANGGFNGRCDGLLGRYAWSLSDSENVLTITPEQDACAIRAQSLQGDWWRAACRIGPTCLGDLDAGTYGSQYFNARAVGADTWVPVDGSVRYSVPEGWANSDDWPSRFVLMPSASYAGDGTGGGSAGTYAISLYGQVAALARNGSCEPVPDLAVPRTVDGLMAWILEQPDVTASAPQALTLGGLPAAMTDLTLSSEAGRDCGDAPQRSAALLTTAVAPTDGPSVIRVVGKEHVRLIVVDVGGGELAAILIADRDEARGDDPEAFAAFVAEAMPIVQSMQFR